MVKARSDGLPGSPMKPAVFYILLALAEHDSHGYAIMQAVRDRSSGAVPAADRLVLSAPVPTPWTTLLGSS